MCHWWLWDTCPKIAGGLQKCGQVSIICISKEFNPLILQFQQQTYLERHATSQRHEKRFISLKLIVNFLLTSYKKRHRSIPFWAISFASQCRPVVLTMNCKRIVEIVVLSINLHLRPFSIQQKEVGGWVSLVEEAGNVDLTFINELFAISFMSIYCQICDRWRVWSKR